MMEVLANPGGFFEKKSKEEIDMKPPYAIIGTVTLLTLITAFILMRELMENLFNGTPIIAQRSVVSLGLIVVMISVTIGWLMTSSAFYAVSALLGGQGDFKRVVEFVAYGFLPLVLSSAISLLLMITMCSFMDFPINDLQALETAMLSTPYVIASNVTSIILTLWSANIWVFAMIHSTNLTVRDALITVGVPIGIYLIYMLYTLYQVLAS